MTPLTHLPPALNPANVSTLRLTEDPTFSAEANQVIQEYNAGLDEYAQAVQTGTIEHRGHDMIGVRQEAGDGHSAHQFSTNGTINIERRSRTGTDVTWRKREFTLNPQDEKPDDLAVPVRLRKTEYVLTMGDGNRDVREQNTKTLVYESGKVDRTHSENQVILPPQFPAQTATIEGKTE